MEAVSTYDLTPPAFLPHNGQKVTFRRQSAWYVPEHSHLNGSSSMSFSHISHFTRDGLWTLADSLTSLLNGFLDFAAAQAACADPNALGLTVNQCSDWLEVGLEDPLGLVIGVTNVIAGLATLATEIACKCHGALLHLVESIQDCEGGNLTQGARS